MAIASSENIFKLIKSLKKSEKRAFKLYASRNQGDDDLQFLKLFNLFDKQKNFNEEVIREKIGAISNSAFSNLKSHLFEQIMISLRLLNKEKNQNIKIREFIDFAHVLYGKGLHMQALEVLDKAKRDSKKHHNDFSLLIIIELEKMIQSRHITRSKSGEIVKLIEESESLSEKVNTRIKLSNIRIRLHKYYIEKGHAVDKKEEDKLTSFYLKEMSKLEESELEGMELIYYYQSFVWYYYILDEFDLCILYAKKWVQLFKESKELQSRDVDLYMRGYHYVLTSAFHLKDIPTFKFYLQEIEHLRNSSYSKWNLNSQIVSFQYVHNGRMNLHFLEGTFSKGILNIPSTLNRVRKYKSRLDTHKIMIIYYKVSWMYIGNNEPQKAIDYLDYIIDSTEKSLRFDIQCYSRLMLLIVFYELEEFEQFENRYKLIKQFFKANDVSNHIQLLVLEMLHKVSMVGAYDRKAIFITYYAIFNDLKNKRFERRAFIYLDILQWIDSKIKKISLSKAIQSNL